MTIKIIIIFFCSADILFLIIVCIFTFVPPRISSNAKKKKKKVKKNLRLSVPIVYPNNRIVNSVITAKKNQIVSSDMLIRRANQPGDISWLRDCTSIINYKKRVEERESE